MSAIPAVRCTGLSRRFGDTLAVDNLDLEIVQGEIFGLLGPNGAGKTTTIRMITTLLPPPRGTIEVFGADVAARRMAVRRLIGYVPQQLSVEATLTGRENVWLFAKLYDVPRLTRVRRVNEVLAGVGLAEVADRLAKTYSGGMIRRLELAQALVSTPRLLVLDEPTVGLDPVARDDVWERIEQIRADSGMTVLVTTHLMQEADERCDRVALMHRGRIQALGTPAQLRGNLGDGATLDDVFRAYTGDELADTGSIRDVRSARRTARRLS
jgi:ABC-2 type transport system ATP-binding protein